jgi:hypothetical protein
MHRERGSHQNTQFIRELFLLTILFNIAIEIFEAARSGNRDRLQRI